MISLFFRQRASHILQDPRVLISSYLFTLVNVNFEMFELCVDSEDELTLDILTAKRKQS